MPSKADLGKIGKAVKSRPGGQRVLTSGIQSVTIGEQVPERVEHAKMLGVTISNNLTWSKHVDNIVSKAGKRVYMLYQLKRAGISQNDLVKIYVSIIRPVLEYACPVWSRGRGA